MSGSRICPNCRKLIDAQIGQCPFCEVAVGSRVFRAEAREGLTDKLIPNGRMAVVLLLLVNSALFVAIYVSGAQTLAEYGAKWLPAIVHGDWYRLVTAGYLHVQFLHIVMNMIGLFNLGPMVEEIYGSRRMFALYTAATIFGFVLSAVWSPRSYSLGASAGIFGLLGALIAFGLHSKSTVAKHLQQQCLLNAAIGFAMGGLMPMIDNAAHLGGLAGGFGIAYLAGLPENASPAKEKFWGGAALASVFLTLLAFYELWRRIMLFNALAIGAG